MEVCTLKIVSSVGGEKRDTFVVRVHRSEDVGSRLLPPDFYGRAAREGVHHELELVEPEILWLEEDVADNPLHIHLVEETGVRYVCWTGHLPDMERVSSLFRLWSAGTAYTVETGKDFAMIYGQCRGNSAAFFFKIEKEHSITVGEVILE